LADFNDTAERRFGVNFETLARSRDRNKVARRTRFLVGVAIKKQYSDERRITDKRKSLIDVKWQINLKRLREMPSDAWQFQILALSPERRVGENGKAVAARLQRETFLQSAFFKAIHPYLCQNAKTRRELVAILKKFGLGQFARLASPEGLLGEGAIHLYTFLLGALGTLPAAALAVIALALCVSGLNRRKSSTSA